MEQKKTIIKNIEFLRVIGCMAVVLLHLFNNLFKLFPDAELYKYLRNMTSNGNIAVDLFFIISGFFFAYKLNLHKTLFEFLKSKLIRLYPVLIFVILLSFLLSLIHLVHWSFYSNLMTFLGLNGTSLVLELGAVPQFWYVSAMLWILSLFFYLRKNFDKKIVDLFILIVVFFSYSFLIHAQNGGIHSHTQTFYYIFNVGMLRGFGGIGIGYLIGGWYKNNLEKIKAYTLNKFQKYVVTIIEFCSFFFIINNLMLHKLHYKNQFVFIVVFTIMLVLSISRKGYITYFIENSPAGEKVASLAKYTYSVYLTHYLIVLVFRNSLWKYHQGIIYLHPILNIIITLTVIILLGVFTYHFIELPAARYFQKNPKNSGAVCLKHLNYN